MTVNIISRVWKTKILSEVANMNPQEVKKLFLEEKLVAICRTLPTHKLGNVAKALVKGGVKILEITIDQMADDPAAVIKEASSREANRKPATSTPMVLAVASPLSSALYFHAISQKNTRPTVTTAAMMASVR